MGVLSQLGLGLAKTREGLLGAIRRFLPGSRTITPELCEELETALLAADVGTASVSVLMDAVRESVRQAGEADASAVRAVLKKAMTERLRVGTQAGPVTAVPRVILLLGVNGEQPIHSLFDELKRKLAKLGFVA